MSAAGACGRNRGAVPVERYNACAVLAADHQSALPDPCKFMGCTKKTADGCREQKAREQNASNG
jgi:hypothetical protein